MLQSFVSVSAIGKSNSTHGSKESMSISSLLTFSLRAWILSPFAKNSSMIASALELSFRRALKPSKSILLLVLNNGDLDLSYFSIMSKACCALASFWSSFAAHSWFPSKFARTFHSSSSSFCDCSVSSTAPKSLSADISFSLSVSRPMTATLCILLIDT